MVNSLKDSQDSQTFLRVAPRRVTRILFKYIENYIEKINIEKIRENKLLAVGLI